ncbi:tRNA (adenosine(37)-N6)-threonylcarbamoyltransferase complex ATPase subunit type 1 TsaE [Aquimarina sp. BL5]|uniref:tRNA (adenosine(37)-N6)-threonylcarbamoyltransferase complex ATPase subunit type 1 TsaE n=1 Tax=Aquimarina sp. BL5 TaxID=1714860 RepID=UPI000E48572C|nr:tRNA (adenosine(37)-N6)-threonylcarbamoyltransferase complex ATPase subunit type 1 TsaE [Aquimarina sp. BL5]AXT49860.1 tRNA (adenosine(37)-N6)-threonylcarbamoyltransferase complex ATPase subunit type 1 TsaE [Aquimarina sp. BL5]RKM90194.1 tRNA (adenosine(37)-N6)-threonylcarbamoyltransferase complex ATPase subunit type 1 TsaE [Aquimarina sp. BL5]
MKITYTLDELSQTAQHIIKNAKSKKLLFNAAMGVGKTTLIKEICKQLGVSDTISSPTYSLVNEYKGDQHTIYHFDFYRIQDEEEAYDIGFEEYLDTDAWIFIEWPDRISNLLPEDCTKIKIELLDDGKRVLSLG